MLCSDVKEGYFLLDEFEKYVADNELFTHDDKILLTVSGGVDSMVLMSLTAAAGYNFGVAHCNFQLRGKESDEDEVLVEQEARRYGAEFYNKRFDTVGEMERTGESMEMAARRLRYAWFKELCAEHGYTAICIAHHGNDSVETFFINLLRGTGLRGLTGISTQVGHIVRPIMFATRKIIHDYAVAHHIPFREDSSNRSTKYLRNKVRLGVVPMFKDIKPQFTTIMRRNIARLSQAQEFITSAIDLVKGEVMEHNGDIYCCDHFVFPEYYLGNIRNRGILDMLNSEKQMTFADMKTKGLPTQCKECKWQFCCHGECPRNRFAKTKDGESGLNYLCSGYKRFFEHSAPFMEKLKKDFMEKS